MKMCYQLYFLTLMATLCCLVHASPIKVTSNDAPSRGGTNINNNNSNNIKNTNDDKNKPKYIFEEVQLVQPQYISIERFEELLKRAGEIFAPVQILEAAPVVAPAQITAQVVEPLPPLPPQQMKPPGAQPYNYYLPLFDHDDVKLDAKSRKLERFAPPPVTTAHGKQQETVHYYTPKPKKLPKKFDAGAKQVNIKWLNALERDILGVGEVPTTHYLERDERNRINFDDSFFAVDTPVRETDNQPHKEQNKFVGSDGFLNQGEDMSGEDLMAVPAVQLPQYSRQKQ